MQLIVATREKQKEVVVSTKMASDKKENQDFDLFSENVSKPRPFKSSESASTHTSLVSDFTDKVIRPSYRSEKSDSNEINTILEELLLLIKDMFTCHSGAIYWINRNKQQFILESAVSDSKFFNKADRLNFSEKSLLNQVMASSDVLTKFNFSPDEVSQLLPYYYEGERINSFIGFSVNYANEPIAIIVFDSLTPSAFKSEDVHLIKRINQIVAIVIQIFAVKSEADFSLQFNDHISSFIGELQQLKNIKRLNEEIVEVVSKTFEFHYLALVLFDPTTGQLRVQRSVNKGTSDYVAENAKVSLDNSLVGSVMKSLKPIKLRSSESFLSSSYRFSPDEQIKLEAGLICVPVYSSQKCYGAIVLEHEKKGWFGDQHIQYLDQIGFISGLMLENIFFDEVAESHKVYDEFTGIFEKRFFFERVGIELKRAARLNLDCCYMTFEIDKLDRIQREYGKTAVEKINKDLVDLLKYNLREYDYIGRVSESKFATLLPQSDAGNTFLLAEKIRTGVAGSPIKLDTTELPRSITISIGIARFKKENTTLETMVNGSLAALKRAQDEGGNNVKTN